MLIEVTGVCQHCNEVAKILLHNGNPIADCPSCNRNPFAVRVLKGLIYIVSNCNQIGVKIGLTTKTLEQRLKSLNSTGVPGNFDQIAIFPSDNPKADEKRVHDKLRRSNISKEHFDLEPVDAVLGAYRALNQRRPIFFDPELEKTFDLKLEEARIQMQLRLRGVAKN